MLKKTGRHTNLIDNTMNHLRLCVTGSSFVRVKLGVYDIYIFDLKIKLAKG